MLAKEVVDSADEAAEPEEPQDDDDADDEPAGGRSDLPLADGETSEVEDEAMPALSDVELPVADSEDGEGEKPEVEDEAQSDVELPVADAEGGESEACESDVELPPQPSNEAENEDDIIADFDDGMISANEGSASSDEGAESECGEMSDGEHAADAHCGHLPGPVPSIRVGIDPCIREMCLGLMPFLSEAVMKRLGPGARVCLIV